MSIAMFGGLATGLFIMAAIYLFAVIDELSFSAITQHWLGRIATSYAIVFVIIVIVLAIL